MNLTVLRGKDVESARATGKSAVCLCGGGITGALFEVGVLSALDDLVGRAASTEFDVYVGSSAGASVASLLAQGVTADRAFRALRDPRDPFFPLRREDVYRVEVGPWVRAAGRLLRGVAAKAIARLRHREDPLLDDLASLHDLLPAGIFRLDRFADFLGSFYARERLARRFVDLAGELYVVANDVDSAERAVFGEDPLRDVEIAQAIAASSAIPMFFEPVRIDGRDYFDGGIGRVAHVDVAIDHGACRLLVVNPIVPIRNDTTKVCLTGSDGECARLRDKGLLYVGSQALRIMNKARLHFGIKRYLAEHPHVEVVLVEPSDDETLLFVNGSMGLTARQEILDYARRDARVALEGYLRDGRSSMFVRAPRRSQLHRGGS